MAKINTSDLSGDALNWSVARITNPQWWEEGLMGGDPLSALEMDDGERYDPVNDWAQGGPIIEREGIDIKQWQGAWSAELEYLPDDDDHYRYGKSAGPTPLIAAMRCYVMSHLGPEVEVPDGLVTASGKPSGPSM